MTPDPLPDPDERNAELEQSRREREAFLRRVDEFARETDEIRWRQATRPPDTFAEIVVELRALREELRQLRVRLFPDDVDGEPGPRE
jgi:hypothetical protein